MTAQQLAQATHYHAGHNIPGYLPMDDEPYAYSTFADAKTSIIDDLDRAGDHYYAAGEDEDERGLGDDYSAAMEELNLNNGPEWDTYLPTSTSEHDLGEHWWIVQCSEPDCMDDDQ